MPVFAVLAPLDNQKIGPAIEATFADNFFRASNGQWFVSAQGTAKQISDLLGISEGGNGAGIVLTVASYWGRSNPDLWPWLAARMEK